MTKPHSKLSAQVLINGLKGRKVEFQLQDPEFLNLDYTPAKREVHGTGNFRVGLKFGFAEDALDQIGFLSLYIIRE